MQHTAMCCLQFQLETVSSLPALHQGLHCSPEVGEVDPMDTLSSSLRGNLLGKDSIVPARYGPE